jgi:CRISPR-associated protein Csb2
LFQALVAAAAAQGNQRMRLEHAVPALRWLERTQYPLIVATAGQPAQTGYRIYFPDNVGDVVAAAWGRGARADIAEYRDKKDIRSMNLEGNAVHYLFPIAANDAELAEHRHLLFAAARSISHLGWGIDMVTADASILTGDAVGTLTGEHWLPTENPASVNLRVPIDGTLDDLMRKYDVFLDRIVSRGQAKKFFVKPVPPLSAFRVIGYRRVIEPLPRNWAGFAFYEPDSDRRRSFSAVRAVAVAGMVRSLAGKMARQTGHHAPDRVLDSWVDEYVMGHGEGDGLRPRFSYLPLLTIRPPNIVGGINRVIIAEPPGGLGEHVAWSRRALRGQILLSKEGREEALLLAAGSDDKVLPRYVGTADTWATVTPVVLPGSDEGKFAKAEKLFFKALCHAGYSPDVLAELEFRNASFWPGGNLALSFQRPNYLEKGCWSVYHVRLRWRQLIKGPLAIGAGRHCGLGIFAALGL